MNVGGDAIDQMQQDITRLVTEMAAVKSAIQEIKTDLSDEQRRHCDRLHNLELFQVECRQRWIAHERQHKTENRTLTVISGLVSAAFSTVAGWFGSRS